MRQGPKKKNLQEPQPPPEQEGEDSYRADSDGEDQQIPDDGEYTSQHQSIDLQQYLRNRDNIPSQPSDVNQDDYEDEDDDEEQNQEKQEEEQPKVKAQDKKEKKKEQEVKVKQATSPQKPSKKQRVQQKRQDKQSQKNSEK